MQQSRDKNDSAPEPSDVPEKLADTADKPDFADAFVVQAGKTRHGPRQNFRESEYTQVAIRSVCHGIPPRNIDRTTLWREVNDWLAKDAGFRATGIGEISRKTVERELLKLYRRP
jgi:hypothetical protein